MLIAELRWWGGLGEERMGRGRERAGSLGVGVQRVKDKRRAVR